MCQCVARSDCTVEVANFVYNMDPGACFPAFHGGTIRDTKALTHDVNSFSVELAQPTDFDAGQFVTMQVPGVAGYRGYSMVNFERATITARFRHQEEARRRLLGMVVQGRRGWRARRRVRAARNGDVLPQLWARTSCASPAAAASPA